MIKVNMDSKKAKKKCQFLSNDFRRRRLVFIENEDWL